MSLSAVATSSRTACVLLLGTVANRTVPMLSRYAIPDPVTGGLLLRPRRLGRPGFAGFGVPLRTR